MRTRIGTIAIAGFLCLALIGCTSDGQIAFFGYTTRPPYDMSIRTVYVPIFGNNTFARGLEFEMTKAVIRDIEAKTPYKVASCREDADTMLEGKIMFRTKGVNNLNQLNEVRDVQLGVIVDVRWVDLRSGQLLSIKNGARLPEPDGAGFDPKKAPWVQITPSAQYVPELGGSTTSGQDLLCKQAARQIVHMMEVWNSNCAP